MMANVLDKCSVRISLSTIRPPNHVVILSDPFCRLTFFGIDTSFVFFRDA